jgi:hypothetical protein
VAAAVGWAGIAHAIAKVTGHRVGAAGNQGGAEDVFGHEAFILLC